ncbi:DUF1211 domain-containing protein [Secundilactobacillus kimchicus]|uniref:TMEM175 family protein n=1 Tax=Secundilactobacillus kimchicus TaxID=528209 RepID=UPI001C02FCBF|nr:TMEM175 family protein [Secundilactobacillus kimchicus]MBT9670750.1 DUF1211 domain-containing protein [Secundilactobacillus kimchicus]
MEKGRLEAFTDGVMAIIITILVLEIPEPEGATFAALWPLRDKLVMYLLSFLAIAVYWNNHHHLFQITEKIQGPVLWANNFFLLTISLIPFSSAWAGNHVMAFAPEFVMGIDFLFVNLSFYLLIRTIIAAHPEDAAVSAVLGQRYYKPWFSMLANVVGLVLGFFWPLMIAIFAFINLLPWILPERRIDQFLNNH